MAAVNWAMRDSNTAANMRAIRAEHLDTDVKSDALSIGDWLSMMPASIPEHISRAIGWLVYTGGAKKS